MRIILRNDDFGWEEPRFLRLYELCAQAAFTLSAAAIPEECRDLDSWQFEDAKYLELTLHGYAHRNHQLEGKKGEFMDARPLETALTELSIGHKFLQERYPDLYVPVFIPPWNRVSDEIVEKLSSVGCKALSRFGANRINQKFPEFNAQIDLHTRKDGGYASVEGVLADMENAWEAQAEGEPRFVGLMLHHGKMQDADYSFLAKLFEAFKGHEFEVVSYREQLRAWEAWYEK